MTRRLVGGAQYMEPVMAATVTSPTAGPGAGGRGGGGGGAPLVSVGAGHL